MAVFRVLSADAAVRIRASGQGLIVVAASRDTIAPAAGAEPQAVDQDAALAKKVADFKLPVAKLRERAERCPPPQSWYDEDWTDLR